MNSIFSLSVCFIGFVTFGMHSFGQMNQPEVLIVSGRPADDLGFPGENLAFMYNFALSPDGSWWVGEFELDNALDAVVLRGFGNGEPDVVWSEHAPVPGFEGEEFRSIFDDRPNSIDDNGIVVGLARRSLAGFNRPLVFRFDGAQLNVVATQDMAVPTLPLTYGNAFHSPNVQPDGGAAFVAENLVGALSGEDEASLFNSGQQVGQQSAVTQFSGETLESFTDGRFFTSNGSFLLEGRTNDAAAVNDIIVFGKIGTNGNVVLKEDTTPIMLSDTRVEPFDRATQVFLAGNGDWYVLGDTNGQGFATEVAIRNGLVLAAEGDSSPDGFEYDQPIALSGDSHGNFAWIWETTNPDRDRDTILVYNGDQLLLREGDIIMVDYDNDGVDEPAEIELLNLDAQNIAVGGGYVYLMVEIDDPSTTTFLGNAFIRIPVFVIGDVNQDGAVDLLDVSPFVDVLTSGQIQAEADINQDGTVNLLDVSPFVTLLTGE